MLKARIKRWENKMMEADNANTRTMFFKRIACILGNIYFFILVKKCAVPLNVLLEDDIFHFDYGDVVEEGENYIVVEMALSQLLDCGRKEIKEAGLNNASMWFTFYYDKNDIITKIEVA